MKNKEGTFLKRSGLWLLVLLLVFSLTACTKTQEKTVFDRIRESPAARLEKPDGTAVIVDSEIAGLRSFAALLLEEVDVYQEEDAWLYKIVYSPAEKVKNAQEIPVCFYKSYLKIGNTCYYPSDGAPYSAVLEWAQGKFDYFMK